MAGTTGFGAVEATGWVIRRGAGLCQLASVMTIDEAEALMEFDTDGDGNFDFDEAPRYFLLSIWVFGGESAADRAGGRNDPCVLRR